MEPAHVELLPQERHGVEFDRDGVQRQEQSAVLVDDLEAGDGEIAEEIAGDGVADAYLPVHAAGEGVLEQ